MGSEHSLLPQDVEAAAPDNESVQGSSSSTSGAYDKNAPVEVVVRIVSFLNRIEVHRVTAVCPSWATALRSDALFRPKADSTLWILLGLQDRFTSILGALAPRIDLSEKTGASQLRRRIVRAALLVDSSAPPSWFRGISWQEPSPAHSGDAIWDDSWRPLQHREVLKALHRHSHSQCGPTIGPTSFLGLSTLLHSLGPDVLSVDFRFRAGVMYSHMPFRGQRRRNAEIAALFRGDAYYEQDEGSDDQSNSDAEEGLVHRRGEQREWRFRYVSDPKSARGCRAEVGRLREFLLLGFPASPGRRSEAQDSSEGGSEMEGQMHFRDRPLGCVTQ